MSKDEALYNETLSKESLQKLESVTSKRARIVIDVSSQ